MICDTQPQSSPEFSTEFLEGKGLPILESIVEGEILW